MVSEMFSLEFDSDFMEYFKKAPPDIRKRLSKYEQFPTSSFRHEKYGVTYFVDEIGQYRVCFVSDENKKLRIFYFIGDHKEYEKFLGTRK